MVRTSSPVAMLATHAFGLLRRVLAGELPLYVLFCSVANRTLRLAGSGSRRFEFERLYLEHRDPWNYRTSEYEHRKYERTRATALRVRRASGSALEVGCSLGVFTGMIASDFDRIVAFDVSATALRAASTQNAKHAHVSLIRTDLVDFELDVRFDAIFCAEVLYYIRRCDAERVARQLDRLLATDGVLVVVNGDPTDDDGEYFNGWNDVLKLRFAVISKELFADENRPYSITAFARLRS